MVLWGAFAFSLWVTVTGVSSFIFVFLFLSIFYSFLLISQREIRMPRSGHETALNDRVVRAGPTSEGREHGEGHSTVAKYLWLEMLSQHTVGAKGAALERGAGTGRQLYIAQLAEAMPVGREGGKKSWRGQEKCAEAAEER